MMHRLKDLGKLHRVRRLDPRATLYGMAECMKPNPPGPNLYSA